MDMRDQDFGYELLNKAGYSGCKLQDACSYDYDQYQNDDSLGAYGTARVVCKAICMNEYSTQSHFVVVKGEYDCEDREWYAIDIKHFKYKNDNDNLLNDSQTHDKLENKAIDYYDSIDL